MSGTKIIKQLLAERNLTINQLSELLNIQPQSMRNKLYRDKFSFADMCKICHVLGADLCAITQDTHKEFYGNLEHSAAPQETRPIPLDASDLTKRSVSSSGEICGFNPLSDFFDAIVPPVAMSKMFFLSDMLHFSYCH